jgi:hypothetical protein
MKPSSSSILVTLLAKFNVKDIANIEEKVVDVGMDEVCRSSLIPWPAFSLFIIFGKH